MLDPYLQLHVESLHRELRDLANLRPRLDRPEYRADGRFRRWLRTRLIAPARMAHGVDRLGPGVTIRPARSTDARDLRRLAELSERRTPTGRILVAEVDYRIVAALPVDGGSLLSDIRRPTSDVVQLLELRSDQLRAGAEERAA